MKIAVIGTGYVGLVTGICFAELGHTVTCTDVDENKIKGLKKGKMPIYEVGLKEMLVKNIKKKRLFFSINTSLVVKNAEVVFSAVGTPMGENYEADLTYVKQVAEEFANSIEKYTVLITKSTVPVGTGEMIKKIIKKNTKIPFDIVSNPEFLREGTAVQDFMEPDRIVVGTETKRAENIMKQLYEPITNQQVPLICTDIKSSELIKYAANSMLATRISFINEIALYSDMVGANVNEVAKGIGLDERIGPRFLQAGIGYGGSCFPKDVSALIESGKKEGYLFQILEAVESVNKAQKHVVITKLKNQLVDLERKKVVLWGLSFKPETDDIREAPAAVIIEELLKMGAEVHAYDPVAIPKFKEYYKHLNVRYLKNRYETIEEADALVLVTDWDEFRDLDFIKLQKMKNRLLIDGRNIYLPKEMIENGFIYEGIGHR